MQVATTHSEDEIKQIVQGPGDVEWRYASNLFFHYAVFIDSETIDGLRRYEMRRECQEILPGLLLGPFQASKELDRLQSLKITHMWMDFMFSIIIITLPDLEFAYVMPRRLSPSDRDFRPIFST